MTKAEAPANPEYHVFVKGHWQGQCSGPLERLQKLFPSHAVIQLAVEGDGVANYRRGIPHLNKL